jgi:hypothetical protein
VRLSVADAALATLTLVLQYGAEPAVRLGILRFPNERLQRGARPITHSVDESGCVHLDPADAVSALDPD